MTPQNHIGLRTGRTMPLLGQGTSRLSRDTADTIAAALGLGYRMITPDDYGRQAGVGEGIKRSAIGRAEFCLVTNVEETDVFVFSVGAADMAALDPLNRRYSALGSLSHA